MNRLGVDVGGTFTDLVLYGDDGGIRRAKVPTTPGAPEEGVLSGLAALGIAPHEVDLFMHGTTIVTNLVLERNGARVGLLTTAGHEDLLDIQFTYREDPYDLQWDKAAPLVPGSRRLGVNERLRADGAVERPLDEDGVEAAVRVLLDRGAEAIAICFLHAYRNDAHERRAREIVRRVAPGIPVCISAEVDPQIREYQRLSTTVLNAYAMPRARRYITSLQDRAKPRHDVMFMHSGGGALPSALAAELPVFLISSGPAAGVLGATFAAGLAGHDDLIAMDMGGTSTDVSIVSGGQHGRKDTVWVDWMIGARLQAIDINSIGAGGGSIAWVDSGGRLRIGPQSSGADPGPACYGRGGTEATTTDANLVLGILNPDFFLGGAFEVDVDAAIAALERLGHRIGTSAAETARGIYGIVNASMAQAIREITVERGLDPREYTLVPFGGAGGQHAAAVADEIGIRRVLFPSYASVLSAFGLTTADVMYPISRSHMGLLDELDSGAIRAAYQALEERSLAGLRSSGNGSGDGPPELRWAADMRYRGQTSEVRVPVARGSGAAAMHAAFIAEHHAQYRTKLDDPVELINLHLIATRQLPKPAVPTLGGNGGDPRRSVVGTRQTLLEAGPVDIVRRSELTVDALIEAPAIVEDIDSTILIPSGWTVTVERHGHIVIER